MRTTIVLVLLVTHTMLVAIADRLPDTVASAVAATVYSPLWALSIIGLPVFGQAESGGWVEPNVLGWLCFGVFWALMWWVLLQALMRLRRLHTLASTTNNAR